MSQFYSLEEAATKLGISIDQLRELAKKREVRSFQDGGTLRFKSEDIEAKLKATNAKNSSSDSEDFNLNLDDEPLVSPPTGLGGSINLEIPTSENFELTMDDSILGVAPSSSEDFNLSFDDSSSVISPNLPVIASSSDSGDFIGIQDSPVVLGLDFSLDSSVDAAESNSTSSSVILPQDSPFEISESNINLDDTYGVNDIVPIQIAGEGAFQNPTIDDLQIDDDTGLQLDDSGSSSQELSSSIELQADAPEEASDFELSLEESNSEVLSLDNSIGEGTQIASDNSDSEFELTLDDGLNDSGQMEGVADAGLDSSFELEPSDSDSGSQVVEIDDGTEADPMGATAEFNTSDDLEVVEDGSSSQVVAIDDIEELIEVVIEEEAEVENETRETVLVQAGETSWGALPAMVLIPGVLILFVVGLMSLELMRGIYGYNKGTGFSSIIIKPLAEMFTDFPKN